MKGPENYELFSVRSREARNTMVKTSVPEQSNSKQFSIDNNKYHICSYEDQVS